MTEGTGATRAHASMPSIFSLKFLNSKVSVRGRIVAIAVIPVIGFLSNGIAFTVGETDVDGAFFSVRQATALADASEQVNVIIEEISTIASTVAITVEEQNRAVAEIAEGVHRASSEAQGGAEAMGRVAGASKDARAAAADVKSLADTLSIEAESLNAEVHRFLADVQAA
jgi:hypothetical protein